MKRRGFTLIEVLTVSFIIGILASLVIYSVYQYINRGRDTQRKNDLFYISMGFESRYNDATCTEKKYPDYGYGAGVGLWKNVRDLVNVSSNYCDNVTNYIKTMPHDPSGEINKDYKYDLSQDNLPSVKAKDHYRLGAILVFPTSTDLATKVDTWQNVYKGKSYPTNYNYFIGK